jgi:hypothetical protein
MPEVDLLAVAVATVAGFALSAVYYGTLGAGDPDGGALRPAQAVAELLRTAVLAAVVVGLVAATDADGVAGALALGLALWAGFPAVLWAGAVLHEAAPLRQAALHAGDWLLKVPLIAVLGVAIG